MTVIVEGVLIHGHGELLAEGVHGGVLRYLSLAADSDEGGEVALYCAYGRVKDGWVPEYLPEMEVGSSVVVTTKLWWPEGGTVIRTYDEDGMPGCQVH